MFIRLLVSTGNNKTSLKMFKLKAGQTTNSKSHNKNCTFNTWKQNVRNIQWNVFKMKNKMN